MKWFVGLLLIALLSLPTITFEDGKFCWRDSNGVICITFGDAMGIANRLEVLP